MASGGGKYGDLLTATLSVAEAKQGILIILDGKQGPGATMHCSPKLYPTAIKCLEEMVRDMKEEVRRITNEMLKAYQEKASGEGDGGTAGEAEPPPEDPETKVH